MNKEHLIEGLTPLIVTKSCPHCECSLTKDGIEIQDMNKERAICKLTCRKCDSLLAVMIVTVSCKCNSNA